MKERLKALLGYSLYWLLLFFTGRLFFLVFHFHNTSRETLPGLLGTFLHGSMLDISTTGYFLLLPFLFIIPTLYYRGMWYAHFLKWYTYSLVALTSLIVVADANLYSYWGFRMDYTPVFYLKTPGEAVASVSTLKLAVMFSVIVLLIWLYFSIFRKFIFKHFLEFNRVRHVFTSALLLLVLTAALIIPIRGGFGIAPINAGSVYFSERMYLNHAAVNPVWNVGTTAFTQKPVDNPYVFTETADADSTFRSLVTECAGGPAGMLRNPRPNILMIILESFSSYLVGPCGGDSLVTPNLNRFAAEGITFRNLYASGTRTDKALPAIFCGYPAQPAQSIIKEPRKTQSLPSIVRLLSEEGYNSSFWYGGEINFANFNSFVIASGFGEIVTQDNFDPESYNSKWGVHDHILLEAFKRSFSDLREPFFKVVLTLSSHEPFDVPVEPFFEGNDILTQYKNSVYYADKVLGDFLDWSEEQAWWNNTLVVLIADHGARISPDMVPWDGDIFRIPMVWTGGAIAQNGIVIDKLGSQTDLAITILNQMGIECSFPFSKDLLSNETKSFAFYTFNEGFGFVTDSSAVAYDQKPAQIVWQEGKDPITAGNYGKAYLQMLFEDYLGR